MARADISVFGIYRHREDLEHAIRRLEANGFRSDDFSILASESTGNRDFAHEKHTKSPEGATAGGATGAVVGGTLGALLGTGTIFVPELAPLVAAGPLASILAGIGAGGTLGGVVGALVGAGIPEYEAKRYAGLIREGKLLLSVHCVDRDTASRAEEILDDTGAKAISRAGEAKATTKGRAAHHGEKPVAREAAAAGPEVPPVEETTDSEEAPLPPSERSDRRIAQG